MKLRFSVVALVCVLLALVSAAPAFGATVAVGTCLPNKVSFDSLTDAIQGVPPGSTILVCPGIYQEQLVISKSLTLKGQTSGNAAFAAIMPPPGGLLTNAAGLSAGVSFYGFGQPLAAQLVINSGAAVTITDITVDATGYNIPTCNPAVVGILVQDASLTLNHVSIKNQLETGPLCSPGGNGAGLLAQNDSVNPTTVKVQNSNFLNAGQSYESDGASNTSILTNNTLVGNPASVWNAISIITGNSTIQGNSLSDFNYPPADVGGNINGSSFAVLMECVSGGTVANNVIGSSQVGIFLQNVNCPPLNSNVSITGNTVYNAFYIGIDVGQTNGLVQGNDIRNTQTAIRLPGSAAGNTIQNNTINDSCAAFGSNPAAGVNTILNNNISNTSNLAIVNTTALCP